MLFVCSKQGSKQWPPTNLASLEQRHLLQECWWYVFYWHGYAWQKPWWMEAVVMIRGGMMGKMTKTPRSGKRRWIGVTGTTGVTRSGKENGTTGTLWNSKWNWRWMTGSARDRQKYARLQEWWPARTEEEQRHRRLSALGQSRYRRLQNRIAEGTSRPYQPQPQQQQHQYYQQQQQQTYLMYKHTHNLMYKHTHNHTSNKHPNHNLKKQTSNNNNRHQHTNNTSNTSNSTSNGTSNGTTNNISNSNSNSNSNSKQCNSNSNSKQCNSNSNSKECNSNINHCHNKPLSKSSKWMMKSGGWRGTTKTLLMQGKMQEKDIG